MRMFWSTTVAFGLLNMDQGAEGTQSLHGQGRRTMCGWWVAMSNIGTAAPGTPRLFRRMLPSPALLPSVRTICGLSAIGATAAPTAFHILPTGLSQAPTLLR